MFDPVVGHTLEYWFAYVRIIITDDRYHFTQDMIVQELIPFIDKFYIR